MNRFFMFLLLAVALSAFSSAFSSGYLGRVYPYEADSGESTYVVVTMYNKGPQRDDVQVKIYSPDLEIYEKSRNFNMRKRTASRAQFFVRFTGDAEKGYYPVIVTLDDNDGIKEKRHSWVYIN